ncbi:hypothetical protein OIU34_20015 [Pararhizobium sp. BT-229]|uniref:hypothetical protein n=1 Tax=Pararhizobium sp. BT-229 TaxID=2986923 RepID=UPI0021F7F45C|nr:hypothetical protein [Pararhizobium sp. BT-229]MCV9964173.1 hypothetical protein [Pararhizobium sp. BT-229]
MKNPTGHSSSSQAVSVFALLNPTVAGLRATGAVPHYFGLGFIQMKFNETYRMHFWHPALSAIVGEEELHDHRYDFKSHVLHGSTTHEVYEFIADEGGDHGMYEVSCKPGDAQEPDFKGRGQVAAAGSYTMVKGSVYEFPHTQFHRIRATECITLVERCDVVKEMATILKPLADGHVCPFSQTIPQDQLWDYIAELVEDRVRAPGGGYHLKDIPKGVFGEVSKIEEEFLEFKDALKQGNDVMAFIELSDHIGAIRGWLERNHPSITLDHLITMNDATTRAFVNGYRS